MYVLFYFKSSCVVVDLWIDLVDAFYGLYNTVAATAAAGDYAYEFLDQPV